MTDVHVNIYIIKIIIIIIIIIIIMMNTLYPLLYCIV